MLPPEEKQKEAEVEIFARNLNIYNQDPDP